MEEKSNVVHVVLTPLNEVIFVHRSFSLGRHSFASPRTASATLNNVVRPRTLLSLVSLSFSLYQSVPEAPQILSTAIPNMDKVLMFMPV